MLGVPSLWRSRGREAGHVHRSAAHLLTGEPAKPPALTELAPVSDTGQAKILAFAGAGGETRRTDRGNGASPMRRTGKRCAQGK